MCPVISQKMTSRTPHEARAAVHTVVRYYNLRDETVRQWYPDLMQEAWTGYLDGGYASAKRRVARFTLKQIVKGGLTGGHAGKFEPLSWVGFYHSTIPGERIPVIALARLIYSLLGKKGKRGRHSAATKSIILADRADGLKFEVIADLRGLTVDNVKRHYRFAWTLLRYWFVEHAEMLSVEQRELLFDIVSTRKDVLNRNSDGEDVPVR